MTAHRTLARLATGLSICAVLPVASADELVLPVQTAVLSSLPQENTINIPRFDPSLGVLQCVEVELSGDIGGNYGFENTSLLDCSIQNRLDVSLRLLPNGDNTALASCLLAGTEYNDMLDDFDGSNDCRGPSGVNHTVSFSGGCGGQAICGDAIDQFIGTAGNPGVLAMRARGDVLFVNTSFCIPDTCNNVTATMDITVTYRYTPGTPDAAVTQEDQCVDIDVVANDCLGPGESCTGCGCSLVADSVAIHAQPARGTATVLPGGLVRYCPDENTCGQDSFQYRVADASGRLTPPITVSVDVAPENDCPVAVADVATVDEDSSVLIRVLSNDLDPDRGAGCGSGIDLGSIVISTPPANGTAVPDGNGNVRYTPNADYCGSDAFAYEVSDGQCTSNRAAVDVTVLPANDDPVALDDAYGILEGAMVEFTVLENDFDPDDAGTCGALLDPNSLELVDLPTLGNAQPGPGGTVQYRPFFGTCGVDSFTYRVADTAGRTAQATVTVTITPVNEAPVATPDAASVDEGGSVTVPVASNDTDGDDVTGCGSGLDLGSILITVPPAGGTAQPDGLGGVLFTPEPDRCGPDSFQYTIADLAGERSAPVLVSIDVLGVNECPVAVDDAATTDEGEQRVIRVLLNDSDADAGTDCGSDLVPASVTIAQPPTHGSTAVGPGGAVRYTPDPGYCGPDSFRYLVVDGDGCASNPATVTIDVLPVNACPIAQADQAVTDEDEAVVIPVSANDTDEDDATSCGGGLLLTSVLVDFAPGNGQAVPTSAGNVIYTPDPGFCGTDQFRYTIADEDGCRSESVNVTIKVSAVNEPPVAAPDQLVLNEGDAGTVELLLNDFDPDGTSRCGGDIDPTSVQILTSPMHGSASVDAQGRLLYTPDTDYCGSDQLMYRVADTTGLLSNQARLRIKVLPENDCPVAVADTVSTQEDTPILIDVLANDTDVDDGSACGGGLVGGSLVLVTPPANGTFGIDASLAILYEPDADYCGPDLFRYAVVDADGCQSPATTVSILVTPDPDCPVAVDDAFTVLEQETVEFAVLLNDYDPDEAGDCGGGIDPSSLTILDAPSRGNVTALPDGRVRYVGFDDQCGMDSFRYEVRDETGCVSNQALVAITIEPVNSSPIARDDFAQSIEGAAIEIDVLKSGLPEADYDPDTGTACGSPLDPCSVTLVTPDGVELSLGTLDPTDCGRFLYTPLDEPGAGQTWVDTFRYVVRDKSGLESTPATVTIELLGARPEPPVANDDFAQTDFPDPVEIDVLANDTDPNDDLLPGSLMILDAPDCGTAEVVGGMVVFTPTDGECGECVFTYSIEDATGLEAIGTVTVEVNCECPVGPRDRRVPGSLLLFPQFDSRDGVASFLTVTNTDPQHAVEVEYYYVNGENCEHFDRRHLLSPLDTLTVVAEYHHPDAEQGYLYVFARDPESGEPIVHNGLIGQMLILDGVGVDGMECNAVSFRGVGVHGIPTDLDNDGIRDLNGLEYEEAPGEILIPRFFGQIPEQFESELVLVALTGGKSFTTTLDFLIYNDNEVAFSKDYTFSCWDRVRLTDLAGSTSNQFLEFLAEDDPLEIVGAGGALQAGWMRISAPFAQSNTTIVHDAAFYAVLVERNGDGRMSSDLPFESCSNRNGDLLPMGLAGDTD